MKIQVTQQHINQGHRGSCTKDPVALALSDAGYIMPWASPSYIKWMDIHGYWRETETPSDVYYFMSSFDNNGPVEPFEFEIGEGNVV